MKNMEQKTMNHQRLKAKWEGDILPPLSSPFVDIYSHTSLLHGELLASARKRELRNPRLISIQMLQRGQIHM